ncbi:MAG: Protein involved in biosynthesis of mitomycin antibiotics/polyketide fumonisin [Chthonomonadaceae bacterium]|nr:Protein involved in biosynthesis of mitomycin antibiotics/polyketide fumonisin [Chthonomonadaceae bacterium]
MKRLQEEREAALNPFSVSDPAKEDAQTLRDRMQRDGYLFFRGLISVPQIRATRTEILKACAAEGWLKPGSNPEEGIAAPGVTHTEPEPDYMTVYCRVLCGEAFNTLAHDPGLLAVLRSLFAEEPLPHARNIARIIFPQNTRYTTPSHQDYLHIQGTEETYTAWVPLGDCPKELGSLIVLSGSHTAGVYPVHRALGAGGAGIDTDALPCSWAGSDFEEGDVVLFHSLTVHKALPNLSPDRLRLSVDFRYQPLSHPVAPSSLRPHFDRQTWEEIYTDWNSARYQYYWRDLPIRTSGDDPRVVAARKAAFGAPQAPPTEEKTKETTE